MIFPNNNKAVIKKLTERTLKYNKIRNTMVIIAITLTTILFTTLFTISMGILNTMQQQTMRQAGGSAHGSLKYLKDDEFDKLKKHPLIKQIEYSIMVGMGENPEFLKHHTEIRYATDGDAKMNFSLPTKGMMPKSENELAADTKVLDLLGIPKKLGEKLTIHYSVNGQKFSKEFVLSGYWESDAASRASMIYVSKGFVEKIFQDINQDIQKRDIGAGLIFAHIMFKNSLNIEKNIQKVITDSGYSIDQKQENYIAYGVNWAYMSTSFQFDLSSIIAILVISALIIFTGYLIIYNIFQISVLKDIRFYGLLKTIGTTSKQIKRMINKQAFLLSFIGIPIGLIIGFVLGVVLLPIVMEVSTVKDSYVSFNPLIFVGAAVFSMITVFISCRKPGKIAASVSPIEAVRYTGESISSKKQIKNSNRGGKIYRMALSNLTRNKKKTIVVIISMSLSLILLNSVFTITNGFDMDKYVSKFSTTDFVIGHANYFNNNRFRFETDEASQNMINEVKLQRGIIGGGKIFYNIKAAAALHNHVEKELQLFGMEDFPLSQLNIIDGAFNLEKFKTGNYIIEGVEFDDNGKIVGQSSHYQIGDKVTVKLHDGSVKEYEVMAKAEIKYSMHVRYYIQDGAAMYLPADEFIRIIKKPVVMSYVFNVDKQHTQYIEKFLHDYTNKIEPSMDYESKKLLVDEFKSMQDMFLTVGGALSIIIGMIGLLNFINSVLTSIIARRREFAMLQSIGMTDKQLSQLLMYEGFFYSLSTTFIIFVGGTIFSFVIIRGIVSNLWFYSYKFIIMPLFIASPLLILISIMIPFIIYKYSSRQSIVERLREAV